MTYGYVATLRSFLVLWLATLPLTLIGEYGWLAPPALSLIAFLFLTVEQMAIEIEQPFGDDANDLPLEDYILNLETTILEMLPGRSEPSSAERGHGAHGSGADGGVLSVAPPQSQSSNAASSAKGARGDGTVSPSRVRSMTTSTIKRVDYEYSDDGAAAALGALAHGVAGLTAASRVETTAPPPPVVVLGQTVAPPPFEGREQSYLSRLGDNEARRLVVPPPRGGESPDGPYKA